MNTAQSQAALAEREARERAYQERVRMISMDPIDGRTVAIARRLIRDFEHDIPRRYDAVREVRILSSFSHDEDMGVTTFELDLGGTTIRHRLTDQEVLQGGVQDVGRFLDILERREICERYCYPVRNPRRWEEQAIALGDPRPYRQPMTATEVQARNSEHFRGMAADFRVVDEAAGFGPQHLEAIRRMIEQGPPAFVFDHGLLEELMRHGVVRPEDRERQFKHEKERQAAEGKAKDLFIRVAGVKCFETLERGGSWKLIGGSTRQVYKLKKKSSFCIQRDHDGADMCAIVPGVPLWDHLLGIKLMIEHDEERFLKTANVSGAPRGMDQFRPGGITWVEGNPRQRAAYERMWIEAAERLVHPPMFIGIDPAGF